MGVRTPLVTICRCDAAHRLRSIALHSPSVFCGDEDSREDGNFILTYKVDKMRYPSQFRKLSSTEIGLAQGVFQDSLPAWWRISISDGLGYNDRPFTIEVGFEFQLHLGPLVFPDASLATVLPGYTKYRNILIHELTHVWQYYHGYWVIPRSLWANSRFGKDYRYTVTPDDAWDTFNVEQQAQMVEEWFDAGKSTSDDRFVYVDKIIRPGISGGFFKTPLDDIINSLPLRTLRTI
jgi:hypothetical protein